MQCVQHGAPIEPALLQFMLKYGLSLGLTAPILGQANSGLGRLLRVYVARTARNVQHVAPCRSLTKLRTKTQNIA